MVVYITRSIHPIENEYIIQEVKDIMGSGWKLEPVLPEITDDRHYDYEIGILNLLNLKMKHLKFLPRLNSEMASL